MPGGPKVKKRGFVMTGGGAKGLYEAGVIHAFHISGMEFDVITGSSIGAMNSIFYA
jgi:predicted acylesterase/phospholipase RssA